jgi:polyisoprenoid-binding protein YceI
VRKIVTGLAAFTLVSLFVLAATAATFELDPAHSNIGFKVKHLAISNVKGEFKEFSATFDFEPGKPDSWKVEATIQVASLDTGNEDRDEHLRGNDFFLVEKYPTIQFVSTGVEMKGEDEAKLQGDLTIRGVTKPVVLDLKVFGMADFMGTTKAGFEARTKINRKDFGLTWHKVLETGGLVVGDEVEIVLEIEGNLKK